MNNFFFILRKFPYYISSTFALLSMIKNPWALLFLLLRKKATLHVKSERLRTSLNFSVTQLSDILILKETMDDDPYHVHALKRPTCIIDVGAAFGDFAIYASGLFPKARVLAFEPNPEGFTLLQENIRLNKRSDSAGRVESYKVAVSTSKRLDFFVASFNVRSSTVRDKWSSKKIRVKGERLDKYLNDISAVDLLKVDCEGGELDVMDSISPHNMRKIKRAVFEYHRHLIANEDLLIQKRMKTHGFSTQKIPDAYNPDIGYIIASRNVSAL